MAHEPKIALCPLGKEAGDQTHDEAPSIQLEMFLPSRLRHTLPSPQTPPNYLLRPYRQGDEEGFYRVMGLAGWQDWNAERLAPWRKRVPPDSWQMILYEPTGEIVATAMGLEDSSERYPQGGELGWVAADPAHKGKGLGRAVCTAVTSRLIALGYPNIHLYTEDWRLAALHIYLKMGYVPALFAPELFARWQAICDLLGLPFAPESWVRDSAS